MKRTLLLCAAAALALGLDLGTQSIVSAQQQAPAVKTVMDEPLVGGTYEQMLMQEVSLPAHANVAWHSHPAGHEITYFFEARSASKPKEKPTPPTKPGKDCNPTPNSPQPAKAAPTAPKLRSVRPNR